MKKSYICILILMVLFITGCSCEYNVKITNNTYNEEVKLIANNKEEESQLDDKWQIPTDKKEYELPGDPGGLPEYSDIYDYELNNNAIVFTNKSKLANLRRSSAISVCFNKFKITEEDSIITLATKSKISCFEKYKDLNSITINIEIDKTVMKNNADKINGNVYSWYIDKTNLDDKTIELAFIDEKYSTTPSSQSTKPSSSSSSSSSNQKRKSNSYELYIFLGVMLLIMLIGYGTFKKVAKEKDRLDD